MVMSRNEGTFLIGRLITSLNWVARPYFFAGSSSTNRMRVSFFFMFSRSQHDYYQKQTLRNMG